MAAPDPAAVERKMYVDMHLNGVDDPTKSLAELKYMGGGGVNAWRAALAHSSETDSGLDPSLISHGQLAGLDQDDHPQYHNDTRADLRYYQKFETYTQAEVDALIGGPQLQVVEYVIDSNRFLEETDAGKLLVMQSATDTNVTVPGDSSQNLPVGAKVDVIVAGPGVIEIILSDSEVTVNGYDVFSDVILQATSPNSKFTLQKVAANTWFAFGDLYETDIAWQVVVDPATDVRLEAYRVLWVGGDTQPANMAVGDLWVKDAS